MNHNINVENYLQEKGIKIIRNEGKELVVRCLFSDCDSDSKGKEAHLYFEREAGLYHCKKCDAKGNITTLKKHFGDITPPKDSRIKEINNFTSSCVKNCQMGLIPEIKEYIKCRGVSEEIIEKYKIGYAQIWGQNWITIPMKKFDEEDYSFLILRKCPFRADAGPKNLSFPKGKAETTLLGEYAAESENLVICEGIFDCLSLLSKGIKTLTSTGGANTFKDVWVDKKLLKAKNISVCYDRDEAGVSGADKVLRMLYESGHRGLYKTTLPDLNNGGKIDVNDYTVKYSQSVEDLLGKYSEPYPKQIDVRNFKEMTLKGLNGVLSLTIKGDRENKLTTFFGCLSTYSPNTPINTMIVGQSSIGKTFIATNIVSYFPKEDVEVFGNISATALHHRVGKYDKETNTMITNFKGKILLFTEAQNYQVLEKLRSMLSHDLPETNSSITDKSEKGGHRTKNVKFLHYPAVIYCTANLNSDTQEKTRFITLSPELTDAKIVSGVQTYLDKAEDELLYKETNTENIAVTELKKRIVAIKNAEIVNIKIRKPERKFLEEYILENYTGLDPRKQRDVKNLVAIAKSLALLNLWFRNFTNRIIEVNMQDVLDAIELYGPISISQKLNISPVTYNFYKNTIVPLFWSKNSPTLNHFEGLSYQEIINYYFQKEKKKLDYNYLLQNYIPELIAGGLVEKDPESYRTKLLLTDLRSSSFSNEMLGGVSN